MSEHPLRICLVGGGFGGLYTALRLSQLPWEAYQKPEIILIDKNDRFLFSPLLYELMTGEMQTWEIAPPFAELLTNTGIRFHQGCVTGIDVDAQEVKLENDLSIHYDRLVIAIGGKTPLDIVPGAKDYAIPFRTLQDSYRLGEELRLLEESDRDKIRVAVVGGGYSGVEIACKLADRLGNRGRLRLIEKGDSILMTSSEFNREAAKKALEARRIWLDLETGVESISSREMALCYKGQVDVISVDVVLWTIGSQVLPLINNLPLQHNERGLLTVNPYLQTLNHPEIYALGDVADCKDATGQQVAATAQVAFQQSDYCAWNIWATITGRPLLSFRYQNLGEMMTLGVDNATISSLGLKFDGPLAYLSRRLIYLYRLPTFYHQLTVGFNWITQPLLSVIREQETAFSVNSKNSK